MEGLVFIIFIWGAVMTIAYIRKEVAKMIKNKKKIFGYVELNAEGMNLVNTPYSGPFPIIDIDHQWGVEILDHRNISHWIMKGNYTQFDAHTIQIETPQEKVNKIIKAIGIKDTTDASELIKRIGDARNVTEIQAMPGNWNHDDYMCGMYNGMELILAIMEKRDPDFRSLPTETVHGLKEQAERMEYVMKSVQ